MTPEERFEAHEQWLLDHDRALIEASKKHDEAIAEIHAILLELAQTLNRVVKIVERNEGR